MSEILVCNKWSTTDIKVLDPGLERYINFPAVLVPKTGARYAGQKFYKSRISIVERLINKIMVPGHKSKKHLFSSGSCTGKAMTAYNIVFDALTLVEKRTKKNPVEVLVKAVENSAPREEIITIEYGGARYPKAVECAPQRRVDQVLKLFAQSSFQKTHNSKKNMTMALADEIVAAYQMSTNSFAISKKLELERQADASR